MSDSETDSKGAVTNEAGNPGRPGRTIAIFAGIVLALVGMVWLAVAVVLPLWLKATFIDGIRAGDQQMTDLAIRLRDPDYAVALERSNWRPTKAQARIILQNQAKIPSETNKLFKDLLYKRLKPLLDKGDPTAVHVFVESRDERFERALAEAEWWPTAVFFVTQSRFLDSRPVLLESLKARLRAGLAANRPGTVVSILKLDPKLKTTRLDELLLETPWTPTDQDVRQILHARRQNPELSAPIQALARNGWRPSSRLSSRDTEALLGFGRETARRILLEGLRRTDSFDNLARWNFIIETLREIDGGLMALARDILAEPEALRELIPTLAPQLAMIEGRRKTLARLRRLLDDTGRAGTSVRGYDARVCDVALAAFALLTDKAELRPPFDFARVNPRRSVPFTEQPEVWQRTVAKAKAWWDEHDNGASIPPLAVVTAKLDAALTDEERPQVLFKAVGRDRTRHCSSRDRKKGETEVFCDVIEAGAWQIEVKSFADRPLARQSISFKGESRIVIHVGAAGKTRIELLDAPSGSTTPKDKQ